MKKCCRCLHISLSIAFALLSCLSISSPVSASELSIDVGLIASTTNIGFNGAYGDSCPVNLNDGYYINQQTSSYCGITGMTWGGSMEQLGWGIGTGNYLKIYFYGYELRDKEDFHSVQNNGFRGTINVGGTIYDLENVGFSGNLTSQNSAIYEYIFKYNGPSGTILALTLRPGVALAPNELYRMGGIALYGVAGAGADYSSQLSDLIRQNEAIINKLGEGNINDATIINSATQQTNAINQVNSTLQDQNDKIDEQTEAINEQTEVINDVKDTITDDSVDTSSIDYSDITHSVPAFGPIATIINNLIDFPRVFLVDDLCQPLNTPLPEYLGASDSTYLVIPCPSDFLEPYWDAVVLFESIASAYLYFRLAIFIVRQVEYIRDPERDDEEFLQL